MKTTNRLYITDAPQAYDYSYTLNVGPLPGGTPSMRVVSIRGTAFEHQCQTDRYRSGMYCAALLGSDRTTVHVTVPVTLTLDVTTFERLGGFTFDELGETCMLDLQRLVDKMMGHADDLMFDDDERPAVVEVKFAFLDDEAVTVEVK